LQRAGLLTPAEAEEIQTALRAIQTDLEAGAPLPEGAEDIHMAMEALLYQRIGALAGKLHTGRSRNDQVACDLRLYVKAAGAALLSGIAGLREAVVARAEQHRAVVMPGYTHTQRAQPVLLAHHLLAYVEMLDRDQGRIIDAVERADVCPLGAGALAGSGFAIDRVALAKDLGFAQPSANSLDAVSDRDFVLELLAALSILMVHLSRLAGEIVLWTSTEFDFAELPDNLASGSSMMPNKKNPCAAELVRAKSGIVAGALMSLLIVLKGLPLAYNRDLQEDKEPLFSAVDTAQASLQTMTQLIRGLTFHPGVMREAAVSDGSLLATEAADYLVGKGIPFREAHRMVGQAVAYALGKRTSLAALTLAEWRQFAPAADAGITQALTVEGALQSRSVIGGTAPARVEEALAHAKA
jgi:argininosuccinate lyase